MERRRIAPLLVPSIGEMLFVCILLRTLFLGGQLLNDGDTGWHIVAGDDILRSGRIPGVDAYSHTAQGAPWTSHEWLSEVIFSLTHRIMGLNGVVLLTATVIALTIFFLYKFLLFRKVNPIIAALLTILAASASAPHWLARPHVFSFILTLAFVVILEAYQREGINRLALLPLLMAAWVNLHGGFMLGLILISIYACGNLILSITNPEGRSKTNKDLRTLALTLIATTLAACINPHGPAMLLFPLKLGDTGFLDSVREWASPDFHTEKPFELMLLCYIAILALSRKRPDFFEGATALLLTHMSLRSVRFIPLFAIISTPMAAVRAGDIFSGLADNTSRTLTNIAEALGRISARVASIEARSGGVVWVVLPVIFLFVIGASGGKIGGARVFDYSFSDKKFPVGALEFALKNDIPGNMYNPYAWGGYIIYRGYPRYKVFVDGRIEPYGMAFMKEYLTVERAESDFENILDKYKVDWVIDGADSPLIRALTASGGWKTVYADKTAKILLRTTPEDRKLTGQTRDVP